MPKQRLFVDMDGTLARFHDQVNYLERMFEKDFFRNLEPFEDMVSGLGLFMKQHPDIDVYILSAKVLGEPPYCEPEKHAWLDRYLPEIDRDHRIFTEPGRPKADYIPGGVSQDDYLLDDYNRGLNLFLYSGGRAIKCHNNINQRGLGLHGGSAGHLWMGPMVHTSDTPAMIATELGKHMGLTYQLEDILASYPNVSYQDAARYHQPYSSSHTKHLKQISEGHFLAVDTADVDPGFYGFSDPLNAIRFLSGNEDFREYLLSTSNQEDLSVTAQELRAVCFNVYQNADLLRYLRADRTQLADDVLAARAAASHPIMGQIQYLNPNGTIAYSRMFLQQEEMEAEIRSCKEIGKSISEEWFIPQRSNLPEQINNSALTDRLSSEQGLPIDNMDINTTQIKPSLRSVIQEADDRTAGKAGKTRSTGLER